VLSERDIDEIQRHGLTPEQAARQIEIFKKGAPSARLARPSVIGDGVTRLDEDRIETLISVFETAQHRGRASKMTPASGAASRMFKDLFAAQDALKAGSSADDNRGLKKFLDGLDRFAFYPDLKTLMSQRGMQIERQRGLGDALPILDALLGADGLNYGARPKGLLSFHRYGDQTRTPFEEHLVEALAYTADRNGLARAHFTVSPEHLAAFRECEGLVRERYERDGLSLDIAYSIQKPSTDTIAVDPENRPFRDDDGRLVFRPAGHGALIENLGDLRGDLVFIKNIDNVVPDRLKHETVRYKKALGGLLVEVQDRIFAYMRRLEREPFDAALREELLVFAAGSLGVRPSPDPVTLPLDEAKAQMIGLLNRPIRVCGMVKNEGEPGGGPFWVRKPDGESLQIVESSQIDHDDPEQRRILAASTHFNPVDIVCGLRDYRGEPFDLKRFIDRDAYFVSEKSKDGRPLKALERPGLWNGAMAYWNTLFVEVPASTFHPVKTVNDLLRNAHQDLGAA